MLILCCPSCTGYKILAKIEKQKVRTNKILAKIEKQKVRTNKILAKIEKQKVRKTHFKNF